MKRLEPITWSYLQCQKEASELEDLLKKKEDLNESKDILPFFQTRKHLSALCGKYNPYVTVPGVVATEFELFGDFRCDLVAGNWETNYCFVEFEDATSRSVFEKKPSKATLQWGRRFEQGYSQIIDWFHKLDDMKDTTEYTALFGKKDFDYVGLLVIGRDTHLELREKSAPGMAEKKDASESQEDSLCHV